MPRCASTRKDLSSWPGKQDGPYSPDAPNALVSPISIRIKEAAAEGYTKEGDKPAPYHGYYFKTLKGQGPNAAGGAKDYLQRGLMIGGFAVIAWPSEYGCSLAHLTLGRPSRVTDAAGFAHSGILGGWSQC